MGDVWDELDLVKLMMCRAVIRAEAAGLKNLSSEVRTMMPSVFVHNVGKENVSPDFTLVL